MSITSWTTTTCSPRGWAGAASTRRGWTPWRTAFARRTRTRCSRRDAGELGFYALADGGDTVDAISDFAEGGGQAFSNLVVLGIGGSALGTVALRTALLHPYWNELDDEAREFYPRLYVLDNVDPATFGAFLDRIDLAAPSST